MVKYIGPFALCSQYECKKEFDSIEDIFYYLGEYHSKHAFEQGRFVGNKFLTWNDDNYIVGNQYIVYDSSGLPVQVNYLKYIFLQTKFTYHDRFWYNKWHPYNHSRDYRYAPVPKTGKKRWTFGRWYKRPKTTQELRWNEAYEDFTRGKRRNLPVAWDDYERSDVRNRRNWKQNRKTQWKERK